ncbi:hypothetical protein NA56DRAFT_738212 [Hyaloscypha hepaticicola]|uniref:Uncharacterized protein n=1 Tax=Hyaloscypha hepaticicola TaxID=2082293 RepID=A0A2J6QGZ6_9HELO|nr:hypothetical protein NA56DRAFT_738212 [Hyaloscypha hepaticicola]
MHQSSTMHFPVRDPMREYQKQQEKLALIELECIVDWTRKSVLARKANVSRLNGELSEIHQSVQSLEHAKKAILDNLSKENAWTDPGNQRQTLKLLEINSEIRDKQAEIKLIQDKLLAPSQEIKDLELDEEELSAELEDEAQKWQARWPEQEECCMILKLELSRVQAELDATYELVQKGIAKMEPPKADLALVDVPCATRLVHERGLKNKAKSRTARKAINGDLIAIEGEFSEEKEPITVVAEDPDTSDLVDLLAEYQDENQATCRVAAEEKPEIRDIADIVNVVVELMKKRFGSSSKDTKDEKSELAELNKLVHMMQPLYNIGLAIRKRQVEIDSQKSREEKDQNVILEGNSAAHHAQVLADATWMMDTPEERTFKEMYSGVPAKTVWENRSPSTFLDILNWNLNMRQFSPTGGIDRKRFDKLFKAVLLQ